jgi:hypothetical protein
MQIYATAWQPVSIYIQHYSSSRSNGMMAVAAIYGKMMSVMLMVDMLTFHSSLGAGMFSFCARVDCRLRVSSAFWRALL